MFFPLVFMALTSLTTVDLLCNERGLVIKEVLGGYYRPVSYYLSKGAPATRRRCPRARAQAPRVLRPRVPWSMTACGGCLCGSPFWRGSCCPCMAAAVQWHVLKRCSARGRSAAVAATRPCRLAARR